ncbi:MAG: tetratricopeptide repeat protein [Pseudomonadota bacterium]
MKSALVRIVKLFSPVALIFMLLGCGSIPMHMGSSPSFSLEKTYSGPAAYYFMTSRLLAKQGQLDRAIILLQKAIEADPDTVFLRFELAILLISQKDFTGALRVVEEILAKDPENVDALMLLGRIHQSLERPDEAKKAYERVITVDSKQENTYVLLGKIYMDSGESDKALRVYERLVDHFPESYLGHFFIGKIFAEQGKIEAAEAEFKKTIQLAPGLEEPQFELLKLYEQQGREDKKLSVYEDVLAKDPRNVEMLMELALFYANTGKLDESKVILKQLGQRSLTDRMIVSNIAQKYLEKENYTAAIVVIGGMLQGVSESSDLSYLMGLAMDGNGDKNAAMTYLQNVKPDSRFFEGAIAHIAFLYQELGRIHEAIAFIKEIISQVTPTADLLFYLGSFYEEIENYTDSENAFLQGLRLAPENVRILFRLGVLYDKKGDRESAIREMKTVIQLEPNHTNALNYLGYTYADMGILLDEAEQLVLKAIETQPDDGYIIDSLGWVYYKKGLYDRAVSVLEKAVSLVPDDPTILEHMADAYLKINAKEKALECYRRSLNKKEKDKEILEEKIRVLTEKEN